MSYTKMVEIDAERLAAIISGLAKTGDTEDKICDAIGVGKNHIAKAIQSGRMSLVSLRGLCARYNLQENTILRKGPPARAAEQASADDVCRAALKMYGLSAQTAKATEEMAEAIQELQRFAFAWAALSGTGVRTGDPDHLAEELADVEIMVKQMAMGYGIKDKIAEWRGKKLARLAKTVGVADAE